MKYIFTLLVFFLTRNFFVSLISFFIFQHLSSFFDGSKTKSPKSGDKISSFSLNLIALSAFIIKADGKVSASELDFVRLRFAQMYGKDKANAIFSVFNNNLKNENLDFESICISIRKSTSHETRIEILNYLFGIALSDGFVSQAEINKIEQASYLFNLSTSEFEWIKRMYVGFDNRQMVQQDAYSVLGLSPSASDKEIKEAYRSLVMKYHPDRVTTDDPAIKKGAEDKFKKIQTAYDTIKKQRNL